MYKRVKAMENENDYLEIIDELQDRFGDIPFETERLLRIARMKVWAKEAGVTSIKETNKVITIQISEQGTANIDGAKVVSESLKFGRAVGFRMDGQQLLLTIDERKTDKQLPFDILEEIMKLLPTAKREESAPVAE